MCLHKFDVSDEVILAFHEKRQNIEPGTGFPTWYRGYKTTCAKCPKLFISLPYPYSPFVEIEEVKNVLIGAPT